MSEDILQMQDSEFNVWFNNFANSPNVSEAYRRAVAFFNEYYKNAKQKLINLSFDEMFVSDMYIPPIYTRDENGNQIRIVPEEEEEEYKIGYAKEQERLQAYDKLFYEIQQFGIKEKGFTLEYFKNREFTKEEIDYLVKSYLEANPRFESLLPYEEELSEYQGFGGLDKYYYAMADISFGLFQYKKYNNTDVSLDNISLGFICKYSRFLNLEAKMAHTSRMLYMTEKCFNEMPNERLLELVKLSVMYHDIGRFYQAVYYPDFVDTRVRRVEEAPQLGNHGHVGYYFSVQTLIAEDLIKCNGNMDESLFMHTLMAVVTKLHQNQNLSSPEYDVDYSSCGLDEEKIKALIPFLKEVYSKGKVIDFEAKHNIMDEAEFMEDHNIETITSIVKAITSISEFMKYSDIFDDEHREIKDRIDKYLRQFFSEERLEALYQDPSKLNEVSYLEEMFGIDLPDDFKIDLSPNGDIKEKVSGRFKAIEGVLLDRDFASVIGDVMINGTDEITEELLTTLREALGAAFTITTDMDKIDIINQRINGSWEKTNGSVFVRDPKATGELTREEVISDYQRQIFYSDIGEEPPELEGDTRARGFKIKGNAVPSLNIESSTNKINVLWFQLDQFITVNMRNYKSFEYIRDNNLLDQLRDNIVSLQEGSNPENKEQTERELSILTSLIDEPIEFSKMFINNLLNSRIDNNGNLILDGEGKVPTVFTQDQIKYVRSKTVEEFKKKWEFVGDRPKEGNYPSRSQGNSY